MSEAQPFGDNVRDLSNSQGFQFEFFCERCGNSYRSDYHADVKQRGIGMLRSAGGMLSGRLRSISYAADRFGLNAGASGKAKERALEEAMEEFMPRFSQCRGCGNWVCHDVCWDAAAGRCASCASTTTADPWATPQPDAPPPSEAAAQWQAAVSHATAQAGTGQPAPGAHGTVQCAACGATVEGGKFCAECGAKLPTASFCTNCGSELSDGAKFCGECGTKA